MRKKLILIIPAALLILAAGVFAYANYQVRALVDGRIAELLESGVYNALEYETVTLQLNGNINMQNLHVVDITDNEYVLEDILISDFDYFNEVPRHLSLTAKGLRFPAGIPAFGNSPNRSLNAYLGNIMTADFLPLQINYHYDYVPEENLRLNSLFSISLPDSFQLTAESLMENVSLEQLNGTSSGTPGSPVQYAMLLQDANIPSASLALQDLGLVEAVMAIQGETAGITGDMYRQQLLAQLQTMALFAPQQLQAMAQELVERIAEFLEGQRTLRIAVMPEFDGNYQLLQGEVMGALYIGNFERIREVLNLEIATLP